MSSVQAAKADMLLNISPLADQAGLRQLADVSMFIIDCFNTTGSYAQRMVTASFVQKSN